MIAYLKMFTNLNIYRSKIYINIALFKKLKNTSFLSLQTNLTINIYTTE